ncbi:MAG TPA: barstar family protein [Planctomycetota bacterium]|nr:barstar family protein [Planctomycetota bacterium]
MDHTFRINDVIPDMPGFRLYCVQRTSCDSLILLLSNYGFDIFKVNGGEISDEESLYREMALTLRMDNPITPNLDALADLIGDLPSLPGNRKAILWYDADRTFERVPFLFLRTIHTLLGTSESVPDGQLDLYLLGGASGFLGFTWPSRRMGEGKQQK